MFGDFDDDSDSSAGEVPAASSFEAADEVPQAADEPTAPSEAAAPSAQPAEEKPMAPQPSAPKVTDTQSLLAQILLGEDEDGAGGSDEESGT
jgi:hypothetical protein